MDDYMFYTECINDAKIHINCGYCGEKNCKIKKVFRETVKQFTLKGRTPVFDLKCPFKTPRYKDGAKVKFTVCYGAHNVITKWECDWECEDGCLRQFKGLYLSPFFISIH